MGRLFEEYSDRIYGYCLRRLGSPQDAEDAVQMTFLCAHRALQRGVVPEVESAWLFAIAKNVCRWQQRTIFRRNRMLTDTELDGLAGPSRDDDEELLVGLKEALASIPESQQRALVLREWHGLSSGEVAGRLGMSQPATYALLTRARRSLAHALTTLPQQAALGVVALVYEIRSHIKALFGGGVAVKTVAATTVVAAVAVGGVTVDRVVDRGPRAPSTRLPASMELDRSGLQARSRVARGTTSTSKTMSAGRASLVGAPTSAAPGVVAGQTPGDTQPTTSAGEVADPTSQPKVDPGAASDLTKLPNEVPELPGAELPVLPELLPPLPELPPLPPLPPLPTDLLPPAPEPPPIPAPSLRPVDLPPLPVEPPALPPLPEPLPTLP